MEKGYSWSEAIEIDHIMGIGPVELDATESSTADRRARDIRIGLPESLDPS